MSDVLPPNHKHCPVCATAKPMSHFSGPSARQCYHCQATADRDALAEKMARQKEVNTAKRKKKAKEAYLKNTKPNRDRINNQRKADAKERKVLKKQVDKQIKREAEVVATQLAPAVMAERELASRQLARRSLLHYTERNVTGYQPGWVHEDICRRLEKFVQDVEDKKSPRLMLWVPPRHGKSEIASINLPSWVLGHHPTWEFISASYSVDLPIGFSRDVREKMQSDEYKVMFPNTRLNPQVQAAERWKTTKKGGYRAAGTQGGITGMGAHILSIDDPVKDQEAADSAEIRDKTKNWYGPTAYTRLAPGGGILVIQTRWNDDDLSGWLERMMAEGLSELEELKKDLATQRKAARSEKDKKEYRTARKFAEEFSQSVDRWEIVKYPAIATQDEYLDLRSGRITDGANSTAESKRGNNFKKLRSKGDALHPERWNKVFLSKVKRAMHNPRFWSALYQQNPTPDDGLFFTREMIRYRPSIPDTSGMYRFAAWDLAIGTKTANDWTVGVVGALDWNDNLWIIDMIRGRWLTHQIAENIVRTHVRYGLLQTGIEKGQLELAIRPHLDKLIRQGRTPVNLAEGKESLVPIADKQVRARPLQGRMQQGTIIFPMDQPWAETVIAEMLRFPSGLHDDIVDSLAWLVRMLANHGVPTSPKALVRTKSNLPSWRDRLRGTMGSGKHFMAR